MRINGIRASVLVGLVLAIALFTGGGTAPGCSEAQKITTGIVIEALKDVPAMVAGWKGVDPAKSSKSVKLFNGLLDIADTYISDPTNDNFTKALNAFDEAIAKNLFDVGDPAKTDILARIAARARSLLARLGPKTFAETDPNSDDAKALRRESERELDELKGLIKEGRSLDR